MSINKRAYDIDKYITEIYDQTETQTEDVELIRKLIGTKKNLRILEPFCGNGRILIPLAEDDHKLFGLDQAGTMLDDCREKITKSDKNVHNRISLQQMDVLKAEWPKGFDLIILGGNCFYELTCPEEQEKCIALAGKSLKPGAFLYLDNNHMEGELHPDWQKPPGQPRKAWPTGVCKDGAEVKGSTETLSFDIPGRTVRYKRTVEIRFPDGNSIKKEWIEQCHPPSVEEEMRPWLEKHGFEIRNLFGNRKGQPYCPESSRAIFWAQLKEQKK